MKKLFLNHFLKRLSIKSRITLWYTVFMIVLVSAALSALFLISGSLSARQLRTRLIEAVSDTVSDTHFRLGRLDTDGMDFYRNGVSLFLYDKNGYLLAPKLNLGIQVDSLLQDQTARIADGVGGQRMMIYDLYAVQDSSAFWVRGIISLDEAGTAYRTLLMLVLLTFPLFVFFAAYGGYRVTRSALLPLSKMADTAEQISSGKDLSRRIEKSEARDELSHLGSTINQMLARLQASFEREQQFSSDVSHELRTPLSVIQAQCEYGLSASAGDAEREEALRSISRQARRMNDMAAQLLMLSRADRGVFSPARSDVDLSRLAAGCLNDLAPATEAAGLSLSSDIAPGIHVLGDETLLLRLISNLLSNAMRYNRANGSILLSLSRQDDVRLPGGVAPAALLSIKDSGIGIPPDALSKIWDRFYRADSARSTEGSGLGLSMVRWIAEIHGGTASVKSREGKGSTFLICLPLYADGEKRADET